MEEVKELFDYQKKISDKEYIVNILNWDLRVNAPKNTKEYLIDVCAKTELEIFNLKTNDEYGILLNNCINSLEFEKLDFKVQSCIKNLKEKYDLNKKVPKDFYEEYTKACNVTNTVWENAKEKNDYEMYKPYLEKIIAMTKKYYGYLYSGMDLYDAMLNEYEKGMTSEVIDKLFDELKTSLVPLIKKLTKDKNSSISYSKDYSESELIKCGEYLLNYIGFDMNRGGLGIYPHGFTEKLSLDDVRIAFDHTTDPCSFVSTIIHEGGHGLVEQNMNKDVVSLGNGFLDNLYGLHESQSRFYENILGRNINFWIPIYDDVKKLLKLDIDVEDFVKGLNQVNNGIIRVDADELTYCLHIILRYEIERDIFNDKITVDDLPRVWMKKMKEYLDVEVPNDSLGLMQDVHWSEGLFGYFPSYLLGNIYDGMFLECIEDNLGNVDEILRSGNIKNITNYLKENIYKDAGTYTSKEVIEKLCGREISAKPIIDYFYKKYNK